MTTTQRTKKAITKLRTKLTFREIVERLADMGLTCSISHLSRICAGEREASEVLADTAEQLRAEVFAK